MELLNQIFSEYPHVTYGGVGATACATGALVYKMATRKKPTHVGVNCWFCNQDTVVSYGNRNSWDCPNCEQYNGFQENGDYNKPIPAQYTEHLNQGVPTGSPQPEVNKTLQWVNCQMLVCSKCNNKQTLKIKELASFVPRDDDKYDEEIEVFKRHVEQTYKLCRPCRTAVEHYIRHQSRRLNRALLFSDRLRRSGDADKEPYTSPTPAAVVFLRVVALLACTFLLALAFFGSEEPPSSSDPQQPLSGAASVPKPIQNEGLANDSSDSWGTWPELLSLLPGEALENARLLWSCGQAHQEAVVLAGLLSYVSSVLLAGTLRLRHTDAVACALWLLVLGLHLVERYLQDIPSWLGPVKLCATCLCCLVALTAALA
ncbi:hypothetical protein GJAV_G00172200 [Gymnothorax javanicus]|nr:hypothetical protein GJAV_G00172200 [Gymnothorax javanicus]